MNRTQLFAKQVVALVLGEALHHFRLDLILKDELLFFTYHMIEKHLERFSRSCISSRSCFVVIERWRKVQQRSAIWAGS